MKGVNESMKRLVSGVFCAVFASAGAFAAGQQQGAVAVKTAKATTVEETEPYVAVGRTTAWSSAGTWSTRCCRCRTRSARRSSPTTTGSRPSRTWPAPATSINAKDQAKGLRDFAANVTDIKIGFKAYSRQGN